MERGARFRSPSADPRNGAPCPPRVAYVNARLFPRPRLTWLFVLTPHIPQRTRHRLPQIVPCTRWLWISRECSSPCARTRSVPLFPSPPANIGRSDRSTVRRHLLSCLCAPQLISNQAAWCTHYALPMLWLQAPRLAPLSSSSSWKVEALLLYLPAESSVPTPAPAHDVCTLVGWLLTRHGARARNDLSE